jgi:hypothetical protein
MPRNRGRSASSVVTGSSTCLVYWLRHLAHWDINVFGNSRCECTFDCMFLEYTAEMSDVPVINQQSDMHWASTLVMPARAIKL